MVFQELCGYRDSKRRSLVDRILDHKELIFPVILIGIMGTLSGIAAYGAAKEICDKYKVASPERFQSRTRDDRIIINYDGQDYILMYDNELNRPELFPVNRE